MQLEKRSWFWPIIIFPHQERSHTRSLIGHDGRKPRILKDVKAAFAGRLWFDVDQLRACSHVWGRLMWISIPFDAIDSVERHDDDEGLILVRFQSAKMSGLLRFFTNGGLRGCVLLKLDEDVGEWIRALDTPSDSANEG